MESFSSEKNWKFLYGSSKNIKEPIDIKLQKTSNGPDLRFLENARLRARSSLKITQYNNFELHEKNTLLKKYSIKSQIVDPLLYKKISADFEVNPGLSKLRKSYSDKGGVIFNNKNELTLTQTVKQSIHSGNPIILAVVQRDSIHKKLMLENIKANQNTSKFKIFKNLNSCATQESQTVSNTNTNNNIIPAINSNKSINIKKRIWKGSKGSLIY